MRIGSLIIGWIICCWSVQAQKEAFSVDSRDTIQVQEKLPLYGEGQHYELLDSTQLTKYNSQNLAQVLALESTFFVKNYGPSGISTLSGRGGTASQTAVLWEGFNLQNNMLGQTDLSLIPIFFVDQIALQYGGGSSFFGNSGVGGALHLNSNNFERKGVGLKVQLSGGSFETLQQSIQASYGLPNYSASLRIFHRQAKNNYWLTNTNAFGFPKPVERQIHAATRQWGLLHSQALSYKRHQFTLKSWYQYNHRQLPPTLLSNQSTDQQEDQAWRTALNWKFLHNNLLLKARTALFWEQLAFQSNTVDSKSQLLSSITEVETRWYLGELHTLQAGLHYGYYQAQTQAYPENPSQNRPALFVHYRFLSAQEKWRANVSIRQEWVNAQTQRPAASLGVLWQPVPFWRLNAHASHNYRLPTFNDLYWPTLGNPDLLPEYSWNSELGSSYLGQKGKWQWELGANGFCNLIDNWILWSPNAAGLWRPSNVAQVWARGLEAQLKLAGHWKAWELQFKAQYAFTQSTRTQGEASLLGKQILYVPAHQGNAALLLGYQQTHLLLQAQWTGARFTDDVNSFALPAFALVHLRLEQQLKFGKGKLVLYGQINNLLGADYQIVLNRPMPWQQFEVGGQFFISTL